tara:strand:- start:419 stop:1174 length:756 start_codon:yes stop_codon:yes gene_type:complete
MERKAALVTGSAKRIGAAIVDMLAQDGWDVAIHYQKSAKEAKSLVEKVKNYGIEACAIPCDLSSYPETEKLIDRCASLIGPLSLLINNASMFEYDDIDTFREETWNKTLHTNLRAPIQLARAFYNQLPSDNQGCVINVNDQKVFNLNPDFFSYTISKQALENATKTLALALSPKIRVCGVAPGITLLSGKQTEENFARAHSRALLGKSSEVSDVVQAVKYLVEAPAVTGVTITVDGGQHMYPTKRDVQFEN